MEDLFKVVVVPGGTFAAEFEAALVIETAQEVKGEVTHNRHVGRTVAGVAAAFVLPEDDIEHPVRRGLDGPGAADGTGGLLGAQGARGDIAAALA